MPANDLSLFVPLKPEDAKHAEKLPNHKILALTPKIYFALKDKTNAITSDNVYKNISHLKTALHQKKLLAEFARTIKNSNLSALTQEAAENYFYNLIGPASLYYYSMRGYKNYSWVSNGKIISGNFEQAFISILRQIIEENHSNKIMKFSALHRLLMAGYNRLALSRLKNKESFLIIDGARSASLNLVSEMAKLNPQLNTLIARRPIKKIPVSIRYMIKSLFQIGKPTTPSRKSPSLFFYPGKIKNPQLDFTSNNKLFSLILKAAEPTLRATIKSFEGYAKSNAKIISALKPKYISTDSINDGFEISVCEYAKQQGAKIIFFNHGSHSLAPEKIGAFVQNNWAARGRVYSSHATHFISRSPSAAKLTEQLAGNRPTNLLPINSQKNLQQNPNNKFRILFAGTFIPANQHIPWILETPFEFLNGLKALAAATSAIQNAELIVRIRERGDNKNDLDEQIIRQELSQYNNIVFDNSNLFSDALQSADLLVANLSATIDEALQCGKPVLLHSENHRYFHLPAQTKIPAGGQRNAVYASTPAINLKEFITAIIAAHHNKPLSADELQTYAWAQNEGSYAALAKAIGS